MRPKPIAECLLTVIILVFVLSGVFNYFFVTISKGHECSDLNHYRSLINNSAEKTNSTSRSCYLSRKLIFLKTHKTASSTLSGILWRELCERASLNCFLPPKNNPGRTWDFESAKDLTYMQKSGGTSGSGPPFDAWLHHARMHKSIYSVVKVDTHSDAIRFMSIVRHPAMRFRSAWSWYELSNWFYPSSIALNVFNASYTLTLKCNRCRSNSSRRQGPEFEPRYKKLLQRVLCGKVLLLVADRFDESLLVVRRLMLAQPHPAINATRTASLPDGANNAPNSSNCSAHQFDMPLQQLLYLRQKKQSKVEPLSEATKLKLMH